VTRNTISASDVKVRVHIVILNNIYTRSVLKTKIILTSSGIQFHFHFIFPFFLFGKDDRGM
jgi:hypothetical protein